MENLKAKDIMTRPVVSARKNASARDISLQLLSGLFSGMPVTDERGRVLGIVTEFDLLEHISKGEELAKLTAEDIMSKNPITVDVGTPMKDLLTTMLDKNIIRLPVTNEGRLVGIIARCDILKAFIEPEFETYM
ncbi:MAG: CBS domain-containing protein [Nitrospinae bacterium]|jgi:predicted transcriptional regulator|nr:CBS domain-containing protein [Nitrospinota bacterium]